MALVNPAKRAKALFENYLEARKEGPKNGYEIRLVEPDNYEHYYILVKPIAGVYKGQKYIMEMKTTYGHGNDQVQYPVNAPYMHFVSNIFHVNIHPNGGSICLDILKEKNKWSPLYSFDTIMQSILLLFNEPNNGSPYNSEASRVWVECEKDFKNQKHSGMTMQQSEALYLRCFAPFINGAMKMMRSNDMKPFARWFPELCPEASDYVDRMNSDKEEIHRLTEEFDRIALAAKKRAALLRSAPKNDHGSDTSASVSQPDPSLKKEEPNPTPTKVESAEAPKEKKKNRWAKYQG